MMKSINSKIYFVLFLFLICSVISAGCLAEKTINPLNKNLSEFGGSYDGVPVPENESHIMSMHASPAGYSEKQLLSESDLICYATADSFLPSYWENGIISTEIIFDVNDIVKGNFSDQVTVKVSGGEVNGFVCVVIGPPKPWDFEIGGNYLLCLEETETDELYYILKVYRVND